VHNDNEVPYTATDHDEVEGASSPQISDSAAGLWSELWPTIAFIIVYNVMRRLPEGEGLFTPETALYWATGILMIGMAYEVTKRLLRGKKVSPMLLVTTSMVLVFGILGIVFGKGFLLHKPTIISLTLATIIFSGLMTGRNLWKMMFDGLFALPDYAWTRLATCWGLFFIGMAIWNEVLVATVSEDTWANWKLGNTFISFAFGLALVPYTMKHTIEDGEDVVSSSDPQGDDALGN